MMHDALSEVGLRQRTCSHEMVSICLSPCRHSGEVILGAPALLAELDEFADLG